MLVGIAGEGKRAARADYEVFVEGGKSPIGVVTSGALSPTLGFPVAMLLLTTHRQRHRSGFAPSGGFGNHWVANVHGRVNDLHLPQGFDVLCDLEFAHCDECRNGINNRGVLTLQILKHRTRQ
jgi:hypothetical protein